MTVHDITLASDPDWQQQVNQIYAQVVAQADGGIQRQEAFDQSLDQIAAMIESGEISVNLTDAVRSALLRADDTHGRQADAIIRRVAQGEMPLDFGEDNALDVVVILGQGRRKVWRHVDEDDLYEMDEIRYRNFRHAANAYDEWRTSYEAVLPAVRRHGTVGAAVAADEIDGDAATAS